MTDQPNPATQLAQMLASLIDIAALAADYFQALVNEGLTREEALALTLNWQQTIMVTASTIQQQPPTPAPEA